MTDIILNDLGISAGQQVNKQELDTLLRKINPDSNQLVSSLYLKPGDQSGFMGAKDPVQLPWVERLATLDRKILESETGLIGLRNGGQALIIVPPIPLTHAGLSDTWNLLPLQDILQSSYNVGVVLLRLGRFAVAVYEGDRLISSKTDTRYVKGRHSAGGTSQKRYSRIREGQIKLIYEKTCFAVKDQFTPYLNDMQFVLLGGDKFTLNGLIKKCPMLDNLKNITLGRRLNVRNPRRDTLESVAFSLKESSLYPITWQ